MIKTPGWLGHHLKPGVWEKPVTVFNSGTDAEQSIPVYKRSPDDEGIPWFERHEKEPMNESIQDMGHGNRCLICQEADRVEEDISQAEVPKTGRLKLTRTSWAGRLGASVALEAYARPARHARITSSPARQRGVSAMLHNMSNIIQRHYLSALVCAEWCLSLGCVVLGSLGLLGHLVLVTKQHELTWPGLALGLMLSGLMLVEVLLFPPTHSGFSPGPKA